MNVLIIDCTREPKSFGVRDLRQYSRLVPEGHFFVRRAPDFDLPKNVGHYDAMIISGSYTSILDDEPWIKPLEDFLSEGIHQKKAILGVCYGHQILGKILGGSSHVGRAKKPEIGWIQVRVVNTTPLFKNLPSQFLSFSYHYDEVSQIPNNCTLIAESEGCPIQGFQVNNRPIYGIQFHPEKFIEDAKSMLKKVKKTTLHNLNKETSLTYPMFGQKIFKNFFNELTA